MQANPCLIEEFMPGDVILGEGESNACLYVINEGEAEVVKGSGAGETTLVVLGQGDIFGEMGLIDGQPASATIRATKRTTVWLYDERAFKETLVNDPMLAKKVIDTLVQRLRRTTDMLQKLAGSGGATPQQVNDVLDQHTGVA